MRIPLIFSSILILLLLFSCAINDAKESKSQFVYLYMNNCTKEDSTIFKKFEKEENIKVRIKKIQADTLVEYLSKNKYDCDLDAILLNDYMVIKNLAKNSLFLKVESEVLNENIDNNYKSKKNYWFALSKSPLVFVYHQDVLKRDTINYYSDLTLERWKGKFGVQDSTSTIQKLFTYNMKYLLKGKADSFLVKLHRQSFPQVFTDDFSILKSISQKKCQLAVIQMSNLVLYKQKFDQENKLKLIFPSQRKRGCILNVNAIGMYRYAKNAKNAQKLIEFLSSRKAQFAFASSRKEFPILNKIDTDYDLTLYGRYRGKFIR